MNKKRIVSVLSCIFSISSILSLAQNDRKAGVGEVSEIIIPTSAKIQNNFNLFYEVHLSRKGIPDPSFWYKIVFVKDCSFEFTLIPLIEEDRYDFFFYKVESNIDFCAAVKEEKIVSCNAERIHKTYHDTEQSEQFRANLVDVKAISVKAGDAVYIEVFSIIGNDGGHVLDFRTSSTSFAVKVVNDNFLENKSSDTTTIRKYKPEVVDEKKAIGIFSDILCPPTVEPIFISSIQVNNENVTIQKKLDFAKYSKSEALKKENELKENLPATGNNPNESHNNQSVENKVIQADLKKNSIEVANQRDLPQPGTQNDNAIIKSTADLNSLEEKTAQINHEIVCVKTDNVRNSTRLEVDYALFSLLQEDLKRKSESIAGQLIDYNTDLKKMKEEEKKQEIFVLVKETKEQKTELQIKIKETEIKLKRINKLLRDERKKKAGHEESIFTKCERPEEGIKQDVVTIVKQDSSTKAMLLPKHVIYKVQIGVYKTPVSTDLFKGLTPVFEESFSGGVKYTAGAFTHFSDAQQAKEYIKNMGLTDAFVIAYYKGKRVSNEEARNHENE